MNILKRYINTWEEVCLDDGARLRTYNIFLNIIFSLISFFLLIVGVINGDIGIIMSTSLFTVLSFTCLILQARRKKFLKILTIFRMAVYAIVLLMSIVYGGAFGVSLFWITLYPMVLYLSIDTKTAIIGNIILGAVIYILMLSPIYKIMPDTYALAFRIRYVVFFTTSTACASIYELLRMKTYKYMLNTNKNLKNISTTDLQTGLLNRNAVEPYLERLPQKSSISFSILDIDAFKDINSRYGYIKGDEFLKLLGGTLLENVHKEDEIFRWGGEQFLIISPRIKAEKVKDYLEGLRIAVKQTDFTLKDGTKLKATASIGSSASYTEELVEDTMARVEKALFRAKSEGKNRVVIF